MYIHNYLPFKTTKFYLHIVIKALKHNQAVTQNNIPAQITFQQPISRKEAKNQYGHNEKETQHFENPCTHASSKLIYSI